MGPHEDGFEFEFKDHAPSFLDRGFHVLHGNHADSHEPFAVRAAVVVEPIVVSATERHGVGFFFDGRKIETRRRKKHTPLDAVAVHVLESFTRIRCQVAMLVHGRAVRLGSKRRFVWLAMMTIAFEPEEKLAVRDPLHLRRASAKWRLQITLPQIVGFADMPVDIDHTDRILRHNYLRSRKTSSTIVASTTRSRGKSGFPC